MSDPARSRRALSICTSTPRTACWIATAVLALSTAAHAQAQGDWIDDLPSVTSVAHVIYADLKASGAWARFGGVGDIDVVAVSFVGTLALLRQIIFLKLGDGPSISKDREARLKTIYASYLEAELVVGSGSARRKGFLMRAFPTGQGCKDMECYRDRFNEHAFGWRNARENRERILPQLFPCADRAREMIELRQKYALTVPALDTPAVSGRIDKPLMGLAPSGCKRYGGDANQNGLCDDWEVPAGSQGSKPASTKAAPEAIRMTALRYAYAATPARGLKVSIAKESANAASLACIRVLRADRPSLGAGKPLWQGTGHIESEADAKAPLFANVAPRLEFKVEEKAPFLTAEVTSGPSYGAVHCEQPLKTWEQRHLTPFPNDPKLSLNGLHGPYKNIEVAMKVDRSGLLALHLTTQNEVGYLVVRNTRLTAQGDDSYFVTPPIPSSQGLASRLLQPLLLPEDYYTSHKIAFEKSCEDPAVFKVAATVHTHPITAGNQQISNFSSTDIDGSLTLVPARPLQFGEGNLLDTDIEEILMIDAFDRCIRAFDPRKGGDLAKNPVRKIGCRPK